MAIDRTFRLPNASNRTVVFGRTGSGKTVFMKWLLSHQEIDRFPWVIIDYKQDGEYQDIPFVRECAIGELPSRPGLYIMSPGFGDDEKIDAYFYNCLRKGGHGTLVDEGMSAPQAEPRFRGLRTLLAQGRSKLAPVILGSQRPRRINKSLLSEGDFFARFHMSFGDDLDYTREFMPLETNAPLDEYHCHWYDVRRDTRFVVAPVNPDDALERLQSKLEPKRRFI
jgi:hypothetical protein